MWSFEYKNILIINKSLVIKRIIVGQGYRESVEPQRLQR